MAALGQDLLGLMFDCIFVVSVRSSICGDGVDKRLVFGYHH
jgi:hypothetical protein